MLSGAWLWGFSCICSACAMGYFRSMAHLNFSISFSGNGAFLLQSQTTSLACASWLTADGLLPLALPQNDWQTGFFKPWPGIKFWREPFGHAGARVRNAARTSLFQFLWWLESKGRFSAWPAFALACSRPSYCCCSCLPRSPCVPLFIHFCSRTLPKGIAPMMRFAKAVGETMWWGECVLELRSLWLLRLVTGHAASLARRRCLML